MAGSIDGNVNQNLIQQILAQKNTLTLQLTKDLKFGDRDNEVILLQNILKKLKFLSPSVPIVNNFGVSTLRAVQAFQAKYNILNSRSPQYGIVGPNTRNRLNNLNK